MVLIITKKVMKIRKKLKVIEFYLFPIFDLIVYAFRLMLRSLLSVRTKYVAMPAPIVERKRWGPRKEHSKEVPLPINREERPVLWGEAGYVRQAKWDAAAEKMVVLVSQQKSERKEKIDAFIGQLRRINPIGGYRKRSNM